MSVTNNVPQRHTKGLFLVIDHYRMQLTKYNHVDVFKLNFALFQMTFPGCTYYQAPQCISENISANLHNLILPLME